MFPITVTHHRDISLGRNKSVKDYIEYVCKELNSQKVDKININENRIDFVNSLFNGQGRNHLMSAVDKGYFEFDVYSQTLIYNYSTKRIFIITLLMACAMGVFMFSTSGFWFFGLCIFLWIYGMNWVITYVRHRMFLTRIIKGLKK